MGAVLAAWLTEAVIITWRDVSGKAPDHTINGLPLPADYLATFILFGGLGLIPKSNVGASRFAAALAWGYVVATYLNVVNPSNPLTGAQQAKQASQPVPVGGLTSGIPQTATPKGP